MNKKKLFIGILATVIVCGWGFAGYHYLYPQSRSMSAGDQANILFVVEHKCPERTKLYTQLLQEDGTILVEDAEHLLYECTQEIRADLFYNTLVEEFSKHYDY